MHTHEIVHQLMHWWDDVVFEKYPTWGKLLKANENNELQDQAVNFNRLDLETYFGKQDENGPGHYTQGVKYGIGSEVIAKMLAGAEKQNDIKEALAALEPTARRKRGMELKAAEVGRIILKLQENSNNGRVPNWNETWLLELADKSGMGKSSAYNWWSAFCKETVEEFNALLKNSSCTDLYKSKIWPASQYGQAKSAIAPDGDGLGRSVRKTDRVPQLPPHTRADW